MANAHVIGELARALSSVRAVPGGFSGLDEHGREVRVERAHGLSVDWVVLRAEICSAAELDLEAVLERNAELAFATIVLAHAVYWLRVALPADSAELANPRRAIKLVAEGAASLAPRCTPAVGAAAFDHYAT